MIYVDSKENKYGKMSGSKICILNEFYSIVYVLTKCNKFTPDELHRAFLDASIDALEDMEED